MSDLNEIERGQLCQSTIESLYEATGGLRHFPRLLKRIIENNAWERRVTRGKLIELASLRELITAKPVRGWGEDPKKVEAVIKDDVECLALFREAMLGHAGRPTKESGHIVTGLDTGVTGNSRAYTVSRLKREAPELFAAVCRNELSANAAAIKAGFRKKPTPAESCIRAFRRVDNRAEVIEQFVAELTAQELEYWQRLTADGGAGR